MKEFKPGVIVQGDFSNDAKKHQSVENVKALLHNILERIDGGYKQEGFVPVKCIVILEEGDTVGETEDWKTWAIGCDDRDMSFMMAKTAQDCMNRCLYPSQYEPDDEDTEE